MLFFLFMSFFCSPIVGIPILTLFQGSLMACKRRKSGKPIIWIVLSLFSFELLYFFLLFKLFWETWIIQNSFAFFELIMGAYGFIIYWVPIILLVFLLKKRKRREKE